MIPRAEGRAARTPGEGTRGEGGEEELSVSQDDGTQPHAPTVEVALWIALAVADVMIMLAWGCEQYKP